ncbi:MAG: hypothetical protein D6820_14330 [Lentisphaerae bacterium]|nr:MAG: hypothetical protein D6820_14330 [Lentisphaerota bacterium]
MKKQEVPQDEAIFDGEQELQYAEDDDGRIVTVPSKGWSAKAFALCQYWDAQKDVLAEAAAKVNRGSRSTLYYYMKLRQMTPGMLAAYLNISRFRVWWHLRPCGFEKMPEALRKKYADVLQISLEQLSRLPQDPVCPDEIRVWVTLKDELAKSLDEKPRKEGPQT